MNFYNLQSLIQSRKNTIAMQSPVESFGLATPKHNFYVEPDLDKVDFPAEKPSILLISAVGASGKSALAQELSYRTRLPLLDLAKNKPVGDNTLRGLLTSTFSLASLESVFGGIASGSFGVIIDGLDEGRSITSEGAFGAFLDDIVRMASNSTGVSFVLLGREQSIDAAYIELTDRGARPGIATLNRFTREQAEAYIDKLTGGPSSSQVELYIEARNNILDKLASAFRGTGSNVNDDPEFLSFIGYPPVLDAIATLLREQKNYHKITEELDLAHSSNVEVRLLYQIASKIVNREQIEKVWPKVSANVLFDLPISEQAVIKSALYSAEEQCVRIIEYCLGTDNAESWVADPVIRERYEKSLSSFLPEHPFLAGSTRAFRNVIFEAMSIATLFCSRDAKRHELALRYLRKQNKSTYYLVYFLSMLSPDSPLAVAAVGALINSALEFRSNSIAVHIAIDDKDFSDDSIHPNTSTAQIEVELTSSVSSASKRISFSCIIRNTDVIEIDNRLGPTDISVPCEVHLRAAQEFEITAPTDIQARHIAFVCATLALRSASRHGGEDLIESQVLLSADTVLSNLNQLIVNGASLSLEVADKTGIYHPLIQYTTSREQVPAGLELRQRYLSLRKLLTHFRSHSKGRMAKYCDKVDNSRVAGNEVGELVLKRLLTDRILYKEGVFYFIEPDRISEALGISYTDLRKGRTTAKLLSYLGS